MNQWRAISDNLSERKSRTEGYRSRYYAFLAEKAEEPSAISKFGEGAVNIVIFLALFIGILTVFGVCLSWYGQAYSPEGTVTHTNKSELTGNATGPLTPTPVQITEPANPKKNRHK